LDHKFIWNAWTALGFAGQACFFMRFVIQWLASERKKTSVIPTAFWFLSLAGGMIVLVYGIHRRDSVIIVGQIPGLFLYSRNLWLMRQNARSASSPSSL
jgi:lipid-A-disaccharide synthase-like uncharacterized protein